ncbi:PAS domain S-box protein [Raineyella fluvialis]|nr:PAS domain S-box protein [Raineyella fluvialis]
MSESTETMTELAAAALDQAGDGIIVIDPAGIIQLWNEQATALFGFTAEQAIGQNVEIIIPERLREAHEHGFDAAMATGHLASDGKPRRTRGVTADGGKVYVTMTFAVINGADGAAVGAVAVAREYVKE